MYCARGRTYLEHLADPVNTIREQPVLGLTNKINDGLVVDGGLESFGMDSLGRGLKKSKLQGNPSKNSILPSDLCLFTV